MAVSDLPQGMETTYLPQEILIEIFSRLPTKSVGHYRRLSKQWLSILSSEQFIKSHLTRKPHQESLILMDRLNSIRSIATIKDDAVSRNLELGDDWFGILGSCDGLILLVNDYGEVSLVNPITLQQKEVPDSPLALNGEESFSMYGFGYDSSIDDYKIVALSYYDTNNEYNPDCVDTFVDVYYVKRGVWKRVENSPYDHAVPEPHSGAFLNGAIHWLTSSRELGYRSVIAAFDLVHEVFVEIPAPSSINMENFVFNKLVVLGGCLCMINIKMDIWIMKEYGLAESWTKFSIDASFSDWGIVKPLCFIGNDEVVLVTEDERLVVYNLNTQTLRYMFVDGVVAMFMDGCTFVQSLVSPDFGGT